MSNTEEQHCMSLNIIDAKTCFDFNETNIFTTFVNLEGIKNEAQLKY